MPGAIGVLAEDVVEALGQRLQRLARAIGGDGRLPAGFFRNRASSMPWSVVGVVVGVEDGADLRYPGIHRHCARRSGEYEGKYGLFQRKEKLLCMGFGDLFKRIKNQKMPKVWPK